MWVVVFFKYGKVLKVENCFNFIQLNNLQAQADEIGADRYIIYPLCQGTPDEYVKGSTWTKLNKE